MRTRQFLVTLNARPNGAIGIFESRTIEVCAEDEKDARGVAINKAVLELALETRGVMQVTEVYGSY